MYKTLPSYASPLVCMLLPCASLWPGVYIFLCLHSWVSLFLPLSVFDTLCPFCLYLCAFPSVCLPDHRCSSLHSGRLWVCISDGMCLCFSIYPYVYLLPSLLFSASGYSLCLACVLLFMWVSLSAHVSVCLLFSLCLSVET